METGLDGNAIPAHVPSVQTLLQVNVSQALHCFNQAVLLQLGSRPIERLAFLWREECKVRQGLHPDSPVLDDPRG